MRAVALVVDTSVLVAAANRDDPDQAACAAALVAARPPLVVAAPVLGEAFYLVGKYLGPLAEAQLAESLADARFELVVPTGPDLERAAELIRQYADLPLGGTDALVIATAERDDAVATLDHRHVSVVRPRHRDAFELVP